jgi:type II secretory pathway component PulJ
MKRNCKKNYFFQRTGFTSAPIYTVMRDAKMEGEKLCYQTSTPLAICKLVRGFTLAEALAALIIATMIMITAVGIYMGVKRAEASINKRLQSGFLATEVLQRIAEDIDRIAVSNADVTMSIRTKVERGGYKSSQLVLINKIYDKDNNLQDFEKIIWQSHIDPDANGLVIYRAHSGYALEDKMLDAPKEKYETEKYIPICDGVTIFEVQAASDANVIGDWQSPSLPPAVQISLSFAPSVLDALGNPIVPQESIKTRTVAVDRFKTMSYQFVAMEIPDINQITDINQLNDMNLPDINDLRSLLNSEAGR